MYYVPNILIRRSRAPSDVFTLTVENESGYDYVYNCLPFIPSGGTLNVDWGDGSAGETWDASKNSVRQYHTIAPYSSLVVSFWGAASKLVLAPYNVSKNAVKQCNYNWSALQGLTSLQEMFLACAYLTSPLKSIPAPISGMKSAFQGCTRLPIAFGCTLPITLTSLEYCFYNCVAANYDINDFGSSFPYLTNINNAFQGSYFKGDATAFKNKCSPSVIYASAFTGSRCTNIPAEIT